MPDNNWLGDQPTATQVFTLTASGTGSGSGNLSVTIGTKAVTFAVVNLMTAAQAAAALYDALVNTTAPEFREADYAYAAGGTVVTGTVRTPGLPVGPIVGATSNGITITYAAVTAATGPSDGANALNWSLGHLPTAGESAVIASGASILHGLGTALAGCDEVHARAEYEGRRVGLPKTNTTDPSNPYQEYRSRFAAINTAAIIIIGEGTGSGPDAFFAQGKVASTALTVHTSGQPGDDGESAVEFGVVNGMDGHTVKVFGGSVAWGNAVDSTGATVAAVESAGGSVLLGATALVTAQSVSGSAAVESRGTSGAVTILGGEFAQRFTGSVTSITLDGGGKAYLTHAQASGSPILVTAKGSRGPNEAPVLDCRGTTETRTLATNSEFTGGAALFDPAGTCASQTTVFFDRVSLLASDVGPGISITL